MVTCNRDKHIFNCLTKQPDSDEMILQWQRNEKLDELPGFWFKPEIQNQIQFPVALAVQAVCFND